MSYSDPTATPSEQGQLQISFNALDNLINSIENDLYYQTKRNASGFSFFQVMHEDVQRIQVSYFSLLSEVQGVKNCIKKADSIFSELSSLLKEFTPVHDLMIHPDGLTYHRGDLAKTRRDEIPDERGVGALPNRTLSSMLEKIKMLIPLVPQSYPEMAELDDTYSTGSFSGLNQVDVDSALGLGNAAANRSPGTNRMTMRSGSAQKYGNTNSNITSKAGPGFSKPMKYHPCIRVYGICNYGKKCTYAFYPYDACLSNLKGKCRFGNLCHELHVEFVGRKSDPSQNSSSEDEKA